MMAKPMKTLELHYPMIQFLIKGIIPFKNIIDFRKQINHLINHGIHVPSVEYLLSLGNRSYAYKV